MKQVSYIEKRSCVYALNSKKGYYRRLSLDSGLRNKS